MRQPQSWPQGSAPQQADESLAAVQRNHNAEAAERSAELNASLDAWEQGALEQTYITPEYLSRMLDAPLTPEARARATAALQNLRTLNASGDTLENLPDQKEALVDLIPALPYRSAPK